MSIDTDSPSGSQYLSSSQSSLNQTKKASSEISKTYKHASQLYLTRRLVEAYQELQPIITPSVSSDHHFIDESEDHLAAPIATATTSQRIKIWSLFATLLNAIVDLGPEDGRKEFGYKEYNQLVKRIQNGEVWEQVVRDGYQGREGSVDAEVVYNLSTLLLGQAPSQSVNQSRLETYLSSSSTLQAHTEISNHLNHSFSEKQSRRKNGTDTPKDLTSQIKLLELFTLHVLPRNDEWEFARSFITNSDILDEERREAFLQTLQELQEVKEHDEAYTESEDEVDTEIENEDDRQHTDMSNGDTLNDGVKQREVHGNRKHQRSSSEVDYGIEKAHPNGSHLPNKGVASNTNQTPSSNTRPLTTLPPDPEPTFRKPSPSPPSASTPRHTQHLSPPAQTPRRPIRRSKNSSSSQNTLIAQARNLFTALSNLVYNMTGSLSANPTVTFRFLLFLVAFLMALSRPEIRIRVRRILGTSWDKIRQTVGMGVKVSYI